MKVIVILSIIICAALILYGCDDYYNQHEDINTLISHLESNDAKTRQAALSKISRLGPDGKQAIGAIIIALDDGDELVRAQAYDAIGKIGKGASEAIPRLIYKLGDEVDGERAARTIAIFKGEVVEELIKVLEAGGSKNRINAMVALIDIGKDAKAATPFVLDSLDDDVWQVRKLSLVFLDHISEYMEIPVEPIIECIDDPEPLVGGEACITLAILSKDEQTLNILRKLLYHEQEDMRSAAAFALSLIGPSAKDAVYDLTQCLEDNSLHVVVSATRALGNIGSDASDALPILYEMEANDPLKEWEGELYSVREYVLEAIAKIGNSSA